MLDIVVAALSRTWLPLLISAVVSYVLGSLDFAIIVTKLIVKEDIREKGSGNAGATNVLRSHGKGLAALTTLGDVGKCVLSVLLAQFVWFPLCGEPVFAYYGSYVAGLFCVLGHMYPLFFGFRGGKGVLTILGMMLVLDWPVALIGLAVFIVVVLLSRMVSLGSILAGVSLCVSIFVQYKFIQQASYSSTLYVTAMVILVVALAIMKHASNIKRILNGTENKFGSKK